MAIGSGGAGRAAWPAWLRRLTVGPLETNCYLLAAPGGPATLVDPGGDASQLIRAVEQAAAGEHGSLAAVLLTHGHGDHIGALPGLIGHWPELHVLASAVAGQWLSDPAANLSGYIGASFAVAGPRLSALEPESRVTAADRSWRVLTTPGHTPGCLCYYYAGGESGGEPPVLLSGDVLFEGSVGRTDLPGSSAPKMAESLRLLAKLPPETMVLPGHGRHTTIGAELARNPYLRQALGRGRG